MDWTQIKDFIRPELSVLVVFLWCLGLFLKKVPWFTSEWMIALLLLAVSLIVTVVYTAVVVGDGFTAEVFIIGIIQGVIIAAVAVFGNELVKHVTAKRNRDKCKP